MNSVARIYMNVGRDVIGGLIETVSMALLTEFPKVRADSVDIEHVLDALNVLRPSMCEIETFRGIYHMSRGHWDDGIRMFTEIAARAPNFSYAKALLAFCLAVKGDSSWQRIASEALEEDPTTETRRLLRALIAREDLRAAVRLHKGGRRFVMPFSCVELAEGVEDGKAAMGPLGYSGAVPDARAGDELDANQQTLYLRI